MPPADRPSFTRQRALGLALLLSGALALAACGGGDDDATTGATTPPVAPPATTPVAPPTTAPVAATPLGTPTLSFVSPRESLDLANYTLTSRVTLPVNHAPGANQIAAEVSAVTYNEQTDSLFIIGDEGTYITQLSKAGAVIDTMNLPSGLFGDPEGLTWAGGNTFVVANERERTASLVTYAAGTTLNASSVRTVKLGTTVGNIGLEGVTRDPATDGYIFVKEMTPQGIFRTGIDFAAGTATNGSPTTANPTNLFDPALLAMDDIADVHALSNTLASTAPDYLHLMVLGQENGRILKVDRAGKVHGRLDLPNAPLNLGHEGITFDKQLNMYVTNEAGGGSQSLPQLWVYTPTRSAARVGLSSNLYLNFTGAVAAGTGNIVLTGSNGDTRTIPVTDATQVSIADGTVRIDPKADLDASVTYGVQYAAGVFRDGTGAAVDGARGLSFATAPDTTAPVLQGATPADNAMGVARSANLKLTFSEAIRAGTGTITLTNGSNDTRVIDVVDTSQVSIDGATVTLDPALDLVAGSPYAVRISAGALVDAAGNAFAGILDSTTLNFSTEGTSATPAPLLLITEVNSNAAAGPDFFEIYNYGATTANLIGWKWDDDSASTTDAASVALPDITIPAGSRVVVVADADSAAFLGAWGLPATFPVVAAGGPGLGQSDAVVLFDATGMVAAGFSYKATAITATDGTVINRAAAATGVTPLAAGHAGAVFGGNAASSAVWDGVSTSAPAYRAATIGVAGGFAQPASPTSVGSPGQ